MLAAIARHFPAQTRVSQPSGGYFLWLELPEQMDALKLFHMAWRKASASRRGRSSRRPGASATASA
jgi:DNA-binding transcriptional MocR family regulator